MAIEGGMAGGIDPGGGTGGKPGGGMPEQKKKNVFQLSEHLLHLKKVEHADIRAVRTLHFHFRYDTNKGCNH